MGPVRFLPPLNRAIVLLPYRHVEQPAGIRMVSQNEEREWNLSD